MEKANIRPNTQEDRDRALLTHWQQQLEHSQKAVEVAEKQIAYLTQLLGHYGTRADTERE